VDPGFGKEGSTGDMADGNTPDGSRGEAYEVRRRKLYTNFYTAIRS